jgi:hypothetical protein
LATQTIGTTMRVLSAALTVAAVAPLLGSCSKPSAAPLTTTAAEPGATPTEPTHGGTAAGVRPLPRPASATEPALQTPHDPADAALVELVDGTLRQYGVALTALAAGPAAASVPGRPERVAWDRIVVPESFLSSTMIRSMVDGERDDHLVVLAGPDGFAYRHRALHAVAEADGGISFTWCGHSAGLGVDARTGEVIDDGVGHSHGTGRLVRMSGRWMVESLDEIDLRVLPPGHPDPCAGEAAAARVEHLSGTRTP